MFVGDFFACITTTHDGSRRGSRKIILSIYQTSAQENLDRSGHQWASCSPIFWRPSPSLKGKFNVASHTLPEPLFPVTDLLLPLNDHLRRLKLV